MNGKIDRIYQINLQKDNAEWNDRKHKIDENYAVVDIRETIGKSERERRIGDSSHEYGVLARS